MPTVCKEEKRSCCLSLRKGREATNLINEWEHTDESSEGQAYPFNKTLFLALY